MVDSNYNASLTLKLYLLAALVFGTYGGRVCPMLESLTASEILFHICVTFTGVYLIRHFLLKDHSLVKENRFARLDATLFFFASIPLAIFYNLQYDFTLDSNLKVLFGMTLFGFFTGLILELIAKLTQLEQLKGQQAYAFELTGERQSLVKQMIMMVSLLLITLTTMLTMIAVKDIFWLEHNPERVLDGTGKISVIKEFIFISLVLGGYAITIMVLWSRVMKKILLAQECSLIDVAKGNIGTRLPIFEHNELGSMASLTNEMLDSLESSQEEVKTTRDVAIVSLSALAESRDNETGAHILRTQEYIRALANYLSQFEHHKALLTPSYIELLYKSAPLHDVGKVGIPDSILLKPGKLTDEEFEIMKDHPEIGAKALSMAEKQLGSNSFLQLAKEISLTHHEKWDGSGYPNQLVGQDIPLSGRLMALADVYDALISERVYKKAFSHDKAKSIILEGKGRHFDPELVDAFLAIENEFVAIADKYREMERKENELELNQAS
ncbi:MULTISPECIES: HD-GYP domain-containing protein [Vibrio]|uniref:HD-GYP domain-containing protein n=1 Tax=Vibrio TaxID=662 RepID=UPI000317089B|nr:MULTISPECIES: HD domain-containing phosphohydrolase [Vibrio]KHT35720.1 metal-dependent phosphohydrolase [Vibrio sinaloensis]CAK4068335.1 Cyclic di-GMP phosphodiesterase [Vibrio sp. 16]